MTIYTDRIQLVFAINDPKKQRQAAASLQTLEITESGQEFEKLVPLDPAKVKDYASQFSLPLIAELAELKTAHEAAIKKLGEDHSEAIRKLTNKHKEDSDKIVANFSEIIDKLRADITEANVIVKNLHVMVADLEQYRPYDKRILSGKAFYKRVTQEDMETLLASDLPQLVEAGKTILAFRDNPWPVMLDSEDFQKLVQGVLLSGVFDEADVTAIMRDATRDEAYQVTV